MIAPPQLSFSLSEHDTWGRLFSAQREIQENHSVGEFNSGVQILRMNPHQIPVLEDVNSILHNKTGWQAVPVEGYLPPEKFFKFLKQRTFPIGWFVRDPKDLNYTPEPDIFHDLYGHLPFYTDPPYAAFSQAFGDRALRYAKDPEKLKQWDRLFWFTLEFGLLEEQGQRKLLGGGLLSSISESRYALKPEGGPKIHPFNLDIIRQQSYRLDVFQADLFLIPSRRELYECLAAFEATL